MLIMFMHHIDCFSFVLTIFDVVCPWCFYVCVCVCVCVSLFCLSFPILSIMVRNTRAHRTSTSFSTPVFDSERFLSEKNQETYKKLYIFRSVQAERKVVLDELDLEIRRIFEYRGWLPLMDIDHPPPATLIREFYSNLSVHSYDSNTLVRSWIRGEKYTITPL